MSSFGLHLPSKVAHTYTVHRPCINQAHHRHAYIHTYIVNVHACIHTFINLNRLFWGISGLGVYNSISNSNFTLTSNSSYHFQHLFNNSGSEGLLATKWLVANTHTTYIHTHSRYTQACCLLLLK